MGGSHQVIKDIAAIRAIPNLVIISPADAVGTKKVTNEALNYVGPVALRLTNPSTPVIFKEDYPNAKKLRVTKRNHKPQAGVAKPGQRRRPEASIL